MTRVVLLVVALLLPAPGWSMDITACDTVVPSGATGVLQADLPMVRRGLDIARS